MSEIRIEDHRAEVLSAMKSQMQKALESCGLVAEGYAVTEAPVDTGNLRNSISHKVVDNECFIGTNIEYAPYVEFGTGKYTPGGRQTPWTFQDSSGNWHMTNGQRAKPFLKPAVANHTSEYKQIIEDCLKS